MRESTIEARLIRGVHRLGGQCYKFVSPGNIGVPDRIAILPGGRVIFVELKNETGKLSKMQVWQHARLRGCGADARVLHSVEEVDRFLAEVRDAIYM